MPKVTVGSTVIAYEESGDGAPLILIHGGMGSRKEYVDGLVRHLKTDIRSIAYDQRDSGDTTNEDAPYSMSDHAADCVGLIKAVGLEQVHVMGGSYGAQVALHVAIEHPECVRSLILRSASPGGAIAAEDLASVRATSLSEAELVESPEERARRSLEAFYTPQFIDEHPETLAHITGFMAGHDDPTRMQRRLAAAFDHDVCDSVAEISAPTLILHGSDDLVIRVHQAEWLASQIPDSKLVVFEGMRHGLVTEQPERTAALVHEFVLAHE
jgi:pimeloyl-ACP methyl ester carboxylesterase